jgi:hypothetical protein
LAQDRKKGLSWKNISPKVFGVSKVPKVGEKSLTILLHLINCFNFSGSVF